MKTTVSLKKVGGGKYVRLIRVKKRKNEINAADLHPVVKTISLKKVGGKYVRDIRVEDKKNEINAADLPSVIKNVQDELICSDFISHFKENLFVALNEWDIEHYSNSQDSDDGSLNNVDNAVSSDKVKHGIDIICYGLGNFASYLIPRYQLGFLLILKKILHSTQVYIFDPAFSGDEVEFLKELGLNVLDINEEAKRTVKEKTVCFLPHCDLGLYNNLLWANWSMDNLSKLIIIGNSFQGYKHEQLNTNVRVMELAKYVSYACNFIAEIKVSNSFHFSRTFDNLSVHYFKTNSLSSVDPFVWTELDVPNEKLLQKRLPSCPSIREISVPWGNLKRKRRPSLPHKRKTFCGAFKDVYMHYVKKGAVPSVDPYVWAELEEPETFLKPKRSLSLPNIKEISFRNEEFLDVQKKLTQFK